MTPVLVRPDDPVTPLLRGRIRTLFKNLPHAIIGEEGPVHQVRVSSRRLRVLLALVAPKPKGRKVGRLLRSLRDLGRVASASRDFDVCLGLLGAKSAAGEGEAPAVGPFRQRLAAARRRARARMAESFLEFDIAGLRRDLGKVVGRGASDPLTARVRLRKFRELEGGDLIARFELLDDSFDPRALHELRGKVRRLRYAAELSASLSERPSEARAEFRAIQDILGELHDAWVLAEWLARQAVSAETRGKADEGALAHRLEQSFRALARARHRRFLAAHPVASLRGAIDLDGRHSSVA